MDRPPLPRLLLYTLAIVLGVTLIVAASTTTVAFGAYNLEWDGTSDFRELADERGDGEVVLDTTAYTMTEPNGTVAVVLAPEESYSETESDRIREFVMAGGTLVVADNFGQNGNDLLNETGATARLNGSLLRDEREYYRSPTLPVATNVTSSPYTSGVEQLTLNRATSVDSGNATVLVTSSEFAYLDRNETGDLAADDEMAEYPIVTVESIGEGEVVTVSDPSIFINVMLNEPDNRAFATALFDSHERSLLDYSKSSDQPPLAVALLVIRSSTVLQVGLALLSTGLVWGYARSTSVIHRRIHNGFWNVCPPVIVRTLPIWLRGRVSMTPTEDIVDEQQLFDTLRQRYPDWEDEQLQRLIADVLSEEIQKQDNE